MMKVPNKILIDGPAWVGDMIMAQTLFKLLKQQYPKAELTVLAPAWTRALLERMSEVSHTIDLPFDHKELNLKKRYRFAKTLREHGYDWAILLRNSFKSALIPYWARIPYRRGWLGEKRYGLLNDWRKLDKSRYPLMIQRFMALGLAPNANIPTPYPYPQFSVDSRQVLQSTNTFGLNVKSKKVIALCPGAEFGPSKRWPLEYFAQVAKAKLRDGWQVWLFGSKNDKRVTDKIDILTDHQCVNLAGRTTLSQAIDLLSLASIVVSNDSGLMHVAAALNRSLIVLYGSTSPKFTPPLTKAVKILSLDLNCSPCFKRHCPLEHSDCLKKLLPPLVLQAIETLTVMSHKQKVE